MSRFRVGDVIRHRTGVEHRKVFSPYVEGMYCISGDEGSSQQLAENYVDDNYILFERCIQDEVVTEDPLRVQQWRDDAPHGIDYVIHLARGVPKTWYMKQVKTARAYGTDLVESSRKGRWVKSGPLVKIDTVVKIPEDVAVTLEGIPQGYYLKAFRVAGPGELIIKTNGVICKESDVIRRQMKLLRPIVAEIRGVKPDVPGIPAGYEIVRVGSPHPGDLFIDSVGGVAECMKHIPERDRTIVREKGSVSRCDGTLPGIPAGYKVVRFGAVSPEEFYFDTVGNLKQGPSTHRLVVEKVETLQDRFDQAEQKMGAMSSAAFKKWAFDDSLTRSSSVDWGVVERKVRQDAVDAAAYAVSQMNQLEAHVGAMVTEKEFQLVGTKKLLWTSTAVESIFGSTLRPTGRSRVVNVMQGPVDVPVSLNPPVCEREFVNIKSGASVWTSEHDMKFEGTFFIPTGRARKVKVV